MSFQRLSRFARASLFSLAATLLVGAETPPAEQAFREGNPFELTQALATAPAGASSPLYRGYLAASFRDADRAGRELRSALAHASDPDQRRRVLTHLTSALFRERQYTEAIPYLEELLAAAQKAESAEEARDAAQTLGVARGVHSFPAQVTAAIAPTTLVRTVDRAGLTRIDASVNGNACTVVFDTGANLCVAAASFAEKNGFVMADGEVDVQAATGATVRARLGMAESLKLGGCQFRNVPFLVFKDEDLTFAAIQYTIEVIVGFPVISELKSVRVLSSGTVELGVTREPRGTRSLAFDGLSPLVAVTLGGRTLPFLLDTGASHSSFREATLKAVPTLADAVRTSTAAVGGAGGVVQREHRMVTEATLTVGHHQQRLENLLVWPNTQDPARHYFGSLGTDILFSGIGYELDFEHMEFHLLSSSAPAVDPHPKTLPPTAPASSPSAADHNQKTNRQNTAVPKL